MSKAGALLLAISALRGQTALEIVEKAQERTLSKSEHYTGTLQVIDAHKKVTAEVKGVALLVVNHPERASDQWMWTPALERDRRIALQDRSARFFGTDFSFEDLEERDVNQFSYNLLGEEPQAAAACWKLESRPKQTKASQYTSSQLWIRKDNYVIIRIDHYKKDKLMRRIDYSDVEKVQGIWTPKTFEVADPARNSRTVMKIENLRYDTPMQDSEFTVEALRHAR
jgi:outer membrane lipoprotein-sorting protein